jgi:hypothetical protein
MALKKVAKVIAQKVKGTSGGTGTTSSPRGMFGKLVSKMAEKAKSATANSAGMAATGMKKGGAVKKKAASDMAGRAMKKTSADAKGRAMKKGK